MICLEKLLKGKKTFIRRNCQQSFFGLRAGGGNALNGRTVETPSPISLFAPAKINLMLAVTGTRPDGFHALVSLVAPISLGDSLEAADAAADSLACDAPGVPTDSSNLVLRATELFRTRVPACAPVAWRLEKRVPHGAGLGGGSSDAAAALRLLNARCGNALAEAELRELAAGLGSDVPLFLSGVPVVMRGRGERVEALPPAAAANLRGRRFLLFKPAFGVSTAEAYGAMKRNAPRDYVSEAEAEARLRAWTDAPESAPLPLFNNMERAVFRKHLALPALFEILRERCGLEAHKSGSGSACFAEISDATDVHAAARVVRECWGETAFVREISLRTRAD